jgi:hypothetical protein
MRPHWLPNFLARQELGHYRLYVKHRRSVDRIKFTYEEPRSLYSNDPAHGAADSIGTILSALCEYANGRPRFVVSWVPSATDDLGGLDFVEKEQHLNMRNSASPCRASDVNSSASVMHASSPPQKSSSACGRIASTTPIDCICVFMTIAPE